MTQFCRAERIRALSSSGSGCPSQVSWSDRPRVSFLKNAAPARRKDNMLGISSGTTRFFFEGFSCDVLVGFAGWQGFRGTGLPRQEQQWSHPSGIGASRGARNICWGNASWYLIVAGIGLGAALWLRPSASNPGARATATPSSVPTPLATASQERPALWEVDGATVKDSPEALTARFGKPHRVDRDPRRPVLVYRF